MKQHQRISLNKRHRRIYRCASSTSIAIEISGIIIKTSAAAAHGGGGAERKQTSREIKYIDSISIKAWRQHIRHGKISWRRVSKRVTSNQRRQKTSAKSALASYHETRPASASIRRGTRAMAALAAAARISARRAHRHQAWRQA